ncbi:hypothetical protein AFK76_12785, partial [Idiomarina zobellii]
RIARVVAKTEEDSERQADQRERYEGQMNDADDDGVAKDRHDGRKTDRQYELREDVENHGAAHDEHHAQPIRVRANDHCERIDGQGHRRAQTRFAGLVACDCPSFVDAPTEAVYAVTLREC